jgi:hypothetical protein
MAYACRILCISLMSRDEPFRIAAAETPASLARALRRPRTEPSDCPKEQ